METLYTVCVVSDYDHIGQMKNSSAKKECKRLINQTGENWISVSADYLYTTDNRYDDDAYNPCPQALNCVWVVVEKRHRIVKMTMDEIKKLY